MSDDQVVAEGHRGVVHIPGHVALESGDSLESAQIAYETFGRLNSSRSNAILLLGGMSPSPHAASSSADPRPGWWQLMVGPGSSINTDQWCVVCLNYLGGCFGSTGPQSTAPGTGRKYGSSFPRLTLGDIADGAKRCSEVLGLESFACVVGVSMGAMVAAHLLSRYPSITTSHISISGALSPAPYARAIRQMQRDALKCSMASESRNSVLEGRRLPSSGELLARKIGLISYGTVEKWVRTSSDGDADPKGQAVIDLLDTHSRSFWRYFDRDSYIRLSEAMDLSTSCRSKLEASALSLRRALVLGAASDRLFPTYQQRDIADALERSGCRNTAFLELETKNGHDAFLVDISLFGGPIEQFLSSVLSDTSRTAGAVE